jgi:hypothetical protein
MTLASLTLVGSLVAQARVNGYTVGIIFWVCIAAIAIASSLGYYWHLVRKAEIEATLKQDMVARGFSAAEIIAVLNNDASNLKDNLPPAKPMTPSRLPPEHARV